MNIGRYQLRIEMPPLAKALAVALLGMLTTSIAPQYLGMTPTAYAVYPAVFGLPALVFVWDSRRLSA